MRRFALAVLVVALVAVAHVAAALPMGPVCCACLPRPDAQTSGKQKIAISALFCAEAPPADPAQLEMQCESVPDQRLSCVPGEPGLSCITELALLGVACPRSGVPAAGSTTLVALAVSLAVAGALMASRRRRT